MLQSQAQIALQCNRQFMAKPYIPILAFLVLLLLTIPFSFDFGISAVPGWHTTIYSPYFIWKIVATVVLPLLTIGYWLWCKRTDKINWILFACHIVLTISTIIYSHFPTIFLNFQLTDKYELIRAYEYRMKLIPFAWMLFIVGQILFIIYFIRTIKQDKRTTNSQFK